MPVSTHTQPTDTPAHGSPEESEQTPSVSPPSSPSELPPDTSSPTSSPTSEQTAAREGAEIAEISPITGRSIKRRRSKPASYKGVGRPSLFRVAMLPKIIQLAKQGMGETQIAMALGVIPDTFFGWKRENSQVAKALEHGRSLCLDRVERALVQRAIGWRGPTEKVLRDGRVVRHRQYLPPDTTAAMDVLTNRRPDQWKRKTESNQPVGIVVQINAPVINRALAGVEQPVAVQQTEAIPHDEAD